MAFAKVVPLSPALTSNQADNTRATGRDIVDQVLQVYRLANA